MDFLNNGETKTRVLNSIKEKGLTKLFICVCTFGTKIKGEEIEMCDSCYTVYEMQSNEEMRTESICAWIIKFKHKN